MDEDKTNQLPLEDEAQDVRDMDAGEESMKYEV